MGRRVDHQRHIYPSGYEIKPLAEQIEVIARRFGLSGEKALTYIASLLKLPHGAEGWFAIPRWEAIAGSYSEAVWQAISCLSFTVRSMRRYIDLTYLEVRGGRLRQSEHSEKMFQYLGDQQTGSDIIITPAQFGLYHNWCKALTVRQSFSDDNSEFGLGVFQVICMLITCPERERCYEQLHLVCVGDEYESVGLFEEPGFSRVPQIQFEAEKDNTYKFSSLPIRRHDLNGSVTGFLPECR